MKVLMVSKALVVGSYQRKLGEIARLGQMDVVAVVPPSWRDRSYEMRLERPKAPGYELLVSPVAFNGNYHGFFFPRLGRILDEQRPDILHVDEEPYNVATLLAALGARRRGIPYIFFTWQNLVRSYPPLFRLVERLVYRMAAGAIAGTDAAARVLRTKGYRGAIAVIPQFGVDPEVYRPAAPDPEATSSADTKPTMDRPLQIGFAGRLVPEKGVPLLVEACAGLTTHWRLMILGGGPVTSEIERRATELGVQDRVSMPGPRPSSEMPEWLRTLDVLVLPSISQPNWVEQFGRILVEAMASSVAVVGSTCGELPSVIGEGGLTFPEGDVAALRVTLQQLTEDASLRAELGRRGRERVLAHFTNARVAADTVSVYHQVLGKGAQTATSARGAARAPSA